MIRMFLVSLLWTHTLTAPHLIDWKADRKLTWSDFKGKPAPFSNNAALTSTSIHFSFGYGDKGFSYSITCQFDKNRSWVRVRTSYILAHEQAHFDIAELYARKLKKALSEYRYNEKTVSDDLNTLYENLMKEHHAVQARYDDETDHSRKEDKQAQWLKKIKEELEKYQAYKKY